MGQKIVQETQLDGPGDHLDSKLTSKDLYKSTPMSFPNRPCLLMNRAMREVRSDLNSKIEILPKFTSMASTSPSFTLSPSRKVIHLKNRNCSLPNIGSSMLPQ